jgi:hypothetical protein
MCYSKEASFIAGSVITAHSFVLGWKYFWKEKFFPASKVEMPEYKRDFIKFTGLSTFFLGLHQWGQVFAIGLESDFIYRIGLICSISSMFFIMRGFESFTRSRIDSWIFLLAITGVSVDLFSRPVVYENILFYVRGHSHFLWGVVWLILFFYWNAQVYYLRRKSKSESNRRFLFWYPFCVLNLSFLISLVYGYSAAAYQRGNLTDTCTALGLNNMFASFDAINDAPSVWCFIHAIQVTIIPAMIVRFVRNFEDDPNLAIGTSLKERVLLFTLACLFVGAMWLTVPLFPGVAVKMVTQ